MGFHVRREYFRPETEVLAYGAARLGPGTHFYAVELDGRTIGLASSRLAATATGFELEELLQLDLPAMGRTQRAVVRTRAELGSALELREFDFRLESGLGDYRVRGQARGDSLLTLTLDAGAGDHVSTLPLASSATLPAALPLRLAAGGRLLEGRETTARVIDPSALAERTVSVRVTMRDRLAVPDSVAQDGRGAWRAASHDTISVWVVEERYGGVSVTSWLDQEGRIVRSESPMGFTIRRLPYELADQAWRRDRSDPELARGYGAIIESTAIAASADLRAAARSADALAVRLLNVDLTGFDLDGGRQRLAGDTLVVRREGSEAMVATYRLPYAGGNSPADALAATPLAQSGDPRIVEAARMIAAGSPDPTDVARRLNDWVHGSLAKVITPSIPSAVQVLEAGEGDCNEHTVLYVALARALGLPAREATGVVYLDGRFFYHAWPEVWLGDWVAVDPTLGRFPAGPGHLRFLVGGLARQVELVRLIGRLELELVEGDP
jgi:transglutaminase-like putative cysteine protease